MSASEARERGRPGFSTAVRWLSDLPAQAAAETTYSTTPRQLYLMLMFRRKSPEEAAAQRAADARFRSIQSGKIKGLLEKDSRIIRPEVKALIDEALAKLEQQRIRDAQS